MRNHPPLRTSAEKKRTIAATNREKRRRRGDPNITTMNIKAEAESDVKHKSLMRKVSPFNAANFFICCCTHLTRTVV
jgi:hypothetical protein